jgi:hypothetical protein
LVALGDDLYEGWCRSHRRCRLGYNAVGWFRWCRYPDSLVHPGAGRRDGVQPALAGAAGRTSMWEWPRSAWRKTSVLGAARFRENARGADRGWRLGAPSRHTATLRAASCCLACSSSVTASAAPTRRSRSSVARRRAALACGWRRRDRYQVACADRANRSLGNPHPRAPAPLARAKNQTALPLHPMPAPEGKRRLCPLLTSALRSDRLTALPVVAATTAWCCGQLPLSPASRVHAA